MHNQIFVRSCVLFGLSICLSAASLPTAIQPYETATAQAAAKKKTAKTKKAAKTKKKKTVKISFSKSTDTMLKGSKFTFKAKVKNAKASKVRWQSSNTKIISIKKKTGKATAKKAGKATITAMVGKKLVRRTVTVAPTAAQLTAANNITKNLASNQYSSIYTIATTIPTETNKNSVYKEYVSVDKSQNKTIYRTVEDNYFTYIKDKQSYTYNFQSDNMETKELSDEDTTAGSTFQISSNAELASAYINDSGNMILVYMADISGMAKEEQASTGLTSGICVTSVTAAKSTLLITEYEIKNYGSDGKTASTVKGTFLYNADCDLTLPEKIASALPE